MAVCAALCGQALALDARVGAWYHPGTSIENGGFEAWDADTVQNPNGLVTLGSDGAPLSWSVRRAPGKATVSIMKDTAIMHSGKASVRVKLESVEDEAGLTQHFSVEPNTSYTVRLWVRGEGIVAATSKPSAGILIWANSGPAGDAFWGNQKSMHKSPIQASGTFDWQLLEFPVETGPEAARLGVSLQLRWASGTAWFDDVEVVKSETVTPVKSY